MESNFEHIERFFNGTLTPEETTAFEHRRSLDKAFAEEVDLYMQANELVREGARKRLKKHLDDMGQMEIATTMIKTYGRFYLLRKHWYAVAATIVVFIGLGYFAYRNFQKEESPRTLAQVFDDYYEVPGPDPGASRGEDPDTVTRIWHSAFQKYNEKQYDLAIDDFRLLLAEPAFTRKSAANFYLGICYLSMNLPDSAVTRLSKVTPASSFAQDASWYIGLCRLKAGDHAGAAAAFENIASMQKHYKKEQAAEILELLSGMQ